MLVADRAVNGLGAFRYRSSSRRSEVATGRRTRSTARNGHDLELAVPTGHDRAERRTRANVIGELLASGGRRVVVASGGQRRAGEHSTSHRRATRRRTSPRRGSAARTLRLELELKLLSDVGLVGLPNAGKSTLLTAVSRATPKVADYPFTTLEPVLGVVEAGYDSYVMADMPGLIEGAHDGAGLGLEFLRHVERTRLLVHVVDASQPDPAHDIEVIDNELASYDRRSQRTAADPGLQQDGRAGSGGAPRGAGGAGRGAWADRASSSPRRARQGTAELAKAGVRAAAADPASWRP